MNKFNKGLIVTASVFLFVFGLLATNACAAGPAGVNLGSASNFTVLAKTAITTTGTTLITGDIGISPAAASYLTGFGLYLPAASSFATSPLVSGKVYAPGYADPTPANITTAVSDMQTAYTDGMGRTNPTATELGAGNIGGMTLAPGLYKWSTGVTIPSNVTLSGGANDVWIFQIAQNLDVSSAVTINLSGGAQAGNIYWIVAGQTTLGTTSTFNGNILDQTAIVLNTGARLNGKALAQTAVTLDSNLVTPSAASVVTPALITPQLCDYAAPPSGCSYVQGSNYIVATNCGMVLSCPTSSGSSNTSSGVSATSTTSVSSTTSAPVPTVAQIDSLIQILGLNSVVGDAIKAHFNLPVSAGSSASASYSNFGHLVKLVLSNLGNGSVGNDVSTLQHFLISEGKGSAAHALDNHGTTVNFGSLTKAALAEWQASVGITPASGFFGPITRAYIMAHYQ